MRHTLCLCMLPLLTLAAPLRADYLFTNGTLLTMTGEAPRRADLRVVDQRIAEIGSSLAPHEGDEVIDMQGGWLIPGLAEMHAHVPAPDQGEQYRDDVLFLWVANGVTTARGMLGHPDHLALRQALAAHRVLGPRLITSGPSFNGNSVTGEAQARQMVRDQYAAGYDFLKIHPGMTRAQYDAMADEARRLGIRFAGHVPEDVGLGHALKQGQATIDHLDGFIEALLPQSTARESSAPFAVDLADAADIARLPPLIEVMRRTGAAVVPTETLLENLAADVPALLDRPETGYLPSALLAQYRDALQGRFARMPQAALALRKQVIGALHEAGVPILLGSDSPQIFNVPGFSIHRELEALVAAGLTPLEALAAGTRAPARYFGRSDDFGELREGLAADLVLLADDPGADITHTRSIRGVMVRGRWLDRAAIDAGLAAIRKRNGE